jgi:GNAT superfamily N-acetyltransferase
MPLEIRTMCAADVKALFDAFAAAAWHKPIELFDRYFCEQEVGDRLVLIAEDGDGVCGYLTVVWRPIPRRDAPVVPEISDFNVLPSRRRRGIGTSLMDAAEARIAREASEVALGVGLYGDYGSAQRMYAKRGYIPDGNGLHYGGAVVAAGATVRVDDDLLLYLTKHLC